MPTVEERIAHLEGHVIEISQVMVDLRAGGRHLELRMDHLEQRMDRLEERMNARFDTLETKMSRQFMWLVGIQVTSLLAFVTTLGAIVVTLLSRA